MTDHGEISLNTQRNKALLMRSNRVGGGDSYPQKM